MSARHNAILRTVTGIGGDIAIAVAMASACAWLIHTATLGLFLSFLVWLAGAILVLALSQYVYRPAVRVVMSDRRLDDAFAIAVSCREVAVEAGRQLAEGLAQGAGRVRGGAQSARSGLGPRSR